jgi:hypothetical protein
MPETLRGLDFDTGELVEFTVESALPSASLFKSISDAIWGRRRSDFSARLDSVLPAEEAQQLMSEVTSVIDPRFAVGQIDSGLKVFGESPELIGTLLEAPKEARITTENWDERNDWGYVPHTDRKQAVYYADGHVDYSRELAVRLWFETEEHSSQLNYVIQRFEPYQHLNTELHLSYYDGKQDEDGMLELFHGAMTTEQEICVLEAIQKIGGIEIGQ